MKILAIETSCDETAVAIVEDGKKILGEAIASSLALHTKTGGIIPETAAREQLKWIIPCLDEALEKAFGNGNRQTAIKTEIGALAVTTGPGLIGSLLVGVETAKTLAWKFAKPIVPVNHLQAHLYANWLDREQGPDLPLLGMVVSGGHTEIIWLAGHGKTKWIGGTRDDAAGECFDKCARLMDLAYPGGPEIDRLAEKGEKGKVVLPRPMEREKNLELSFSGLKTAVLNFLKTPMGRKAKKEDVALELQTAIIDILIKKLKLALSKYPQARGVVLGGGVLASGKLRERLEKEIESQIFLPARKLCTDNAANIGAAAFWNYKPVLWKKVTAKPNLEIEEKLPQDK